MQRCPHCGSAAFDAITEKEFKCGDCGFNFFPNSACAVVAIIYDADGRMMLAIRGREPWKGMLDLPGGFVDPGEGAETALKREMSEELGAEVTEMRYLCSYPNRYIFSGYEVRTTDLAFECKLRDMSQLKTMDDIDGIVWCYPEDIVLEEIAGESIRNIIAYVVANKS